MTLRRRYEKRLWSLILENDNTTTVTPEINVETLKTKLGKIAQKIKDSGLESAVNVAFSGLQEMISSIEDSIDLKSVQEKEHSILRDIKDEFVNTNKDFYKKYETIVIDTNQYESPNFNDIKLIYLGLVKNVDGKPVYKEGDRVGKSLEFLEKIKTNAGVVASKYINHRDNIDQLKKDFDEIMEPWLEYLRNANKTSPEPDTVDAAIETFDKKINAVVKAYGAWLTENKEAIGEIMKTLQDDDGSDRPKTQTAGYKRLGNTLFEKLLMSRGFE